MQQNQCPTCGTALGKNATYCGCGWRKLKPRFEVSRDDPVHCAHEYCGISAMCKIKTKTGWANLCWQHYDQHFERQAVDNLSKYGMEIQPDEGHDEWVMRMRQFVKGGLKRLSSGR